MSSSSSFIGSHFNGKRQQTFDRALAFANCDVITHSAAPDFRMFAISFAVVSGPVSARRPVCRLSSWRASPGFNGRHNECALRASLSCDGSRAFTKLFQLCRACLGRCSKSESCCWLAPPQQTKFQNLIEFKYKQIMELDFDCDCVCGSQRTEVK